LATYIIRRLIQAIPILIGISVISFAIVHLAPGDPIDRFRSGRVSQETIHNLIRLYGLDKPLLEQFFSWFTAFWQCALLLELHVVLDHAHNVSLALEIVDECLWITHWVKAAAIQDD